MKKFSILLIFLVASLYAFSQQHIPILSSNTNTLSIRDGDQWRENYWQVSPEVALDTYVADKTSRNKKVVFYSDTDSISFDLKPLEHYDFWVVVNGKDSCLNRLKSGITYQKRASDEEQKDTIPFTLTTHNNIVIQAILNKKDTLDLMFHTAVNSISLTNKATEKIASLHKGKSAEVESWGGKSNAEYSEDNQLSIGGFSWENLRIWTSERSGHFTDGKFGPNLFQDKIIEFDFENSMLIIHSTLPAIPADFQKFELLFDRSSMLLNGEYSLEGKKYQNKLMIHSGYGGTILLDDQFSSTHSLGEKLEIISEKKLQDSYGNVIKTKKAILPIASIAGYEFKNLPIGFFEGAIGNQKVSVLGGEILKRFHIFLDLQTAHIYLKPNKLMDLPVTDI